MSAAGSRVDAGYERQPDSGGIWACLGYADGLFWLLYTDVKIVDSPWKNGRNYLVTAPIEGRGEPIAMGNGGRRCFTIRTGVNIIFSTARGVASPQ